MTQMPEMKIDEIEKLVRSNKWKESLALYKTPKELEHFYVDVIAAFSMSLNADKLRNAMTTSQGRQSVFYAVNHAAQTGLSLNPALKQARLATYWDGRLKGNVVSYQIDKEGLIKMAKDAGCDILSDVVRENDKWNISKKFDGDEFVFEPARKDRGEVDGFYCAIRDPSGRVHVKYMTREEIENHRDRYAQRDKDGKFLKIWNDEKDGGSFLGMGLKTVIKAALNTVNIGGAVDIVEPLTEQCATDCETATPISEQTTEELMAEIKRRAQKETKEPDDKTARF